MEDPKTLTQGKKTILIFLTGLILIFGVVYIMGNHPEWVDEYPLLGLPAFAGIGAIYWAKARLRRGIFAGAERHGKHGRARLNRISIMMSLGLVGFAVVLSVIFSYLNQHQH